MVYQNNGQRSGSFDSHLFAYIAGIVDGEGYVTIKRSLIKDRRHKDKIYTYYCYTPIIAITTTDQKFMVWLKTSIPFHPRLWVRKFPNPNWKLSYTLSFHNKHAVEMAKSILFYAKIKKELLEFLVTYPLNRLKKDRPIKEKLYWTLRRINAKSKHQQRLSEETLKYLDGKSGMQQSDHV